jgi:diguanylate cyclase (GGDEF)-like protein
VALIVCLFAAHFLGARIGRAATLYFLAIHIPYAAVVIPEGELPEILRLVFMGGAALFGVQLIAIRRRMEAQLSDLALSDPLTSVANSRYFVAELGKLLAQARRYSVQGSILFMDLDGFKAVNERLGHPGADHVLRSVATELRRGVRDTDILARMGGDEFAVLLPYTDRVRAVVVAERLLDSLHRLELTGAAKGLRISGSIGAAAFPEDGSTVEGLLAAADRAMYMAKEGGRSQVVQAHTASPASPAESSS